MTDQLTTVSLYSWMSCRAYPVYRNTKLLLKGNQTFSLHDSRTSSCCSDNCLLIRTDHGTKQEDFLQMWRSSPQRFFVSILYFVVVDCCAGFENGIDKQENRDERTANFESRKPRRDRITADNRPQKRNGNTRVSKSPCFFDCQFYFLYYIVVAEPFRCLLIFIRGKRDSTFRHLKLCCRVFWNKLYLSEVKIANYLE